MSQSSKKNRTFILLPVVFCWGNEAETVATTVLCLKCK